MCTIKYSIKLITLQIDDKELTTNEVDDSLVSRQPVLHKFFG